MKAYAYCKALVVVVISLYVLRVQKKNEGITNQLIKGLSAIKEIGKSYISETTHHKCLENLDGSDHIIIIMT
jgi:hypothetical protein